MHSASTPSLSFCNSPPSRSLPTSSIDSYRFSSRRCLFLLPHLALSLCPLSLLFAFPFHQNKSPHFRPLVTPYAVRVLPPTDPSTSLPIAFLWGPPYATPADMSVPVHPAVGRPVSYCTVLRVILTALFPWTSFSILMRPFANSTCRRLQLSYFSNTSRFLRLQASLTEDGLFSANRPVSVVVA